MAVILHADVAGSTVLVQQDETLAHLRIRGAFQRLSRCVAQYGGTAHEVRGDALLAAFSRPSDALSAAVRFQLENMKANAGLEDDVRPVVRIGISLGEVVIADGTLTGPEVVLAQRIEQLARHNGVCVSENVRQSVPRRLPFDFESLGRQELKGFYEPVHVYVVSLSEGATVPEPSNSVAEAAPRRPVSRIVFAAAAVLAVAALAWWHFTPGEPDTPPPQPSARKPRPVPTDARPSIAVLPMDNLSGDAAEDYFSDGITEDLITDLSKVSGLFVIARNSTFVYKGTSVDIRKVAEDLGVRYVLEGSVRRAGGRVRINAQLIDAQTGGHVWAERYDGDASDVFALQDRITGAIVRALSVKLLEVEKQAMANNDTAVPEAHDALLLGWSFAESRTLESLTLARAAFEKAVALDPNYAQAWAALVDLYYQATLRGHAGRLGLRSEDVPGLLEKALSRPSPEAYNAKLWWLINQGRVDETSAVIDAMLVLDPNSSSAYGWRASLAEFRGDTASALDDRRKALRLNPKSVGNFSGIGRLYIQMGRYTDAIHPLEQARELDPDRVRITAGLTAAYALAGRMDEARTTARQLVEKRRSLGYLFTVVGEFGRGFLAHPVYRDRLHEGLRLAGIPDEVNLADLNLPPEQQIHGDEMRSLFKARGRVAGVRADGEWGVDNLDDGTGVHYWLGKEFARSDWHIDGDEYVVNYRAPSKRKPYRCTLYRNPRGAVETLDDLVFVCTIGVFTHTRLRLPNARQ
jgi:TolB-like protein/class 3 adenylate cyclase/Tfp pilus assembly protein PilF